MHHHENITQKHPVRHLGFIVPLGLGVTAALGLGIGAMLMYHTAQPEMHQPENRMMNHKAMPNMDAMMAKIANMAPAIGYLKAHRMESKPFELLGGPITINISQHQGGVMVALPDKRKLDPYALGTPEMPRSFGGTPGITGVPPMARGVEDGKYTTLTMPTPFGDKFIVMGGANLDLSMTDATATDAATSNDSVSLNASWSDKDGNTYTIKCNKVIPAGLESPTFGGVVTNHLMHGFTRIGTPLMPTEFAYAAFWGMGTVSKNGKVLDGPRLIHGMLTEYVRTQGYKLAFDDQVTPSRRHFHLMVAPFMPNKKTMHFDHKPVKTGMMLPNGMELPFWHVMFENLEINAQRQ